MRTTMAGPDGKPRCRWCVATPELLAYHDTEWGFPVADDRRLFEKLCLEGFQSGLSWRTILAKRENFRSAFHGFDFDRLARFTERDVARLLGDDGIVRNRRKIEAVVHNARRARELVRREGSLAAFVWRYEPEAKPLGRPRAAAIPPEALALSNELKRPPRVRPGPAGRRAPRTGDGPAGPVYFGSSTRPMRRITAASLSASACHQAWNSSVSW
ncbi:MAG TPA: DNA-3-methyladenine glycosylase I [Thermodesulfobacteriota bacterium]|nr:DNA-3-methyladenine glycosylase I [Thermodesulfobacteriota bacterium]